jgi:hypothetical protein
MEPRHIAALILALLTLACIAGAYLYGTREGRAERRNASRARRWREVRKKERMAEERAAKPNTA